MKKDDKKVTTEVTKSNKQRENGKAIKLPTGNAYREYGCRLLASCKKKFREK